MPPATTTRLTYEDYVKLPDDGKRYEIIDGELFVNPSPIPRHQWIVVNVVAAFHSWFRAHGGGRVFVSPLDVLLEEHSIVQPDVIVIRSDRAGVVGKKNVQGPPHLAIEVLSESTRRHDEIRKRKLYERAGVDEYWIVDPELELVKIYRRAGTAFGPAIQIDTETGGKITSPLFPGFALDLADVFGA